MERYLFQNLYTRGMRMRHNPRDGELGGAYEVRKKEKVRWIRGILIICMLLGAGIYYFTKSPLSAIHPAYDPELALPAMDSQGIRVGSEDDLYLIGGLGGLSRCTANGSTRVGNALRRAVALGVGVAFLDHSGRLLFEEEGEQKIVAEQVSAIGQFGSKLLYCRNDNRVFQWDAGETELLVCLPENETVYQMFGNDKQLVISSFAETYGYRDGTLWKTDIGALTRREAFLYGDSLILIAYGLSGGTAYRLTDQTESPLRIDVCAEGKEAQIDYSVAANGEFLYLSVRSRCFEDLKNDVEAETIRIDPTDWTVERVDSTYHRYLLVGKDGLYALDWITKRGRKIVQ